MVSHMQSYSVTISFFILFLFFPRLSLLFSSTLVPFFPFRLSSPNCTPVRTLDSDPSPVRCQPFPRPAGHPSALTSLRVSLLLIGSKGGRPAQGASTSRPSTLTWMDRTHYDNTSTMRQIDDHDHITYVLTCLSVSSLVCCDRVGRSGSNLLFSSHLISFHSFSKDQYVRIPVSS